MSRGAGGWRARVRDHRGTGIAGAGVHLSEDTVLTCAHVVEAALRLPRTGEPPDGTVLVDFPATAAHPVPVRAAVAEGGWLRSSPAGDLAVLRLTDPAPAGTAPAPAGRFGTGTGGEVAVFGHPAGVPGGLWARGRVAGAGGTYPAWWQIDGLDLGGAPMQRGFSGAGVWDDARGLVVGVLTAVPGTAIPDGASPPRGAWMIPLDTLDGTAFALPARPGGSAPVPAGPASPSALWPLVDRLLALESLRLDAGAQLLGQLPAGIVSGIARRTTARLQLHQIVHRCGEFEEGPAALVRAVRWMEGDTAAVREFVEQARKTWPDRLDDDV
ncbi:trypsin-like peptidase domain-containing protein [Streptomyces griseosporeus]|uniref:trypsin-like peptidase domain-containing protein n=1 Tax=Streptomyces griseosporeus TaxID=1910 RepID=UPI0036FA93FA